MTNMKLFAAVIICLLVSSCVAWSRRGQGPRSASRHGRWEGAKLAADLMPRLDVPVAARRHRSATARTGSRLSDRSAPVPASFGHDDDDWVWGNGGPSAVRHRQQQPMTLTVGFRDGTQVQTKVKELSPSKLLPISHSACSVLLGPYNLLLLLLLLLSSSF